MKMKIHKKAIQELFTANNKVLDAEEILAIGMSFWHDAEAHLDRASDTCLSTGSSTAMIACCWMLALACLGLLAGDRARSAPASTFTSST